MSEIVTVTYEEGRRDFIAEERDRHEKKYEYFMARGYEMRAMCELDEYWNWGATYNLIYKNERVQYNDRMVRRLQIEQIIKYFDGQLRQAEHKMNYWGTRAAKKPYISVEHERVADWAWKAQSLASIVYAWKKEIDRP